MALSPGSIDAAGILVRAPQWIEVVIIATTSITTAGAIHGGTHVHIPPPGGGGGERERCGGAARRDGDGEGEGEVEEGARAADEAAPMENDEKTSAAGGEPPCDRYTAATMGDWNIIFHLPPALQKRLRLMINIYIAEPWSKAAEKAEAEGRAAPTTTEVIDEAKRFFDDFFSMRVLEEIDEIRKTIGSTGDKERRAIREGTADEEVIERTFPLIPGSYLPLSDPALEFTKQICHLISFEPALEGPQLRLKRNALRLLGVREFATEGVWVNPSLSFVLVEVHCGYCGHCRDLDLCRDPDWNCGECGNQYEHEAIENRLITLVQRRSLAHQLQDVECSKCKSVKRTNLAPFCGKCAGPFELRLPQEKLSRGLQAFANIAAYHGMPWLAETVDFLRTTDGGAISA